MGESRRVLTIVTGVLAALLIAAVAALHSPLFGLDHIEISGVERADVSGRIAATGVGEGALLLWIDTDAIAAAVVADPWVSAVEVTRRLPATLSVEVTERRPAFSVAAFESWLVVAGDGVVVDVTAAPHPGLLTVSTDQQPRSPGTRPDDPLWNELVALAAVLQPELAMDAVLADEAGEWWLEAGGRRIRFGAASDFRNKALTAQAMLGEDLTAGWVIDVVSPQRPAAYDPNSQPPVEGGDS